MGKYEITSEQLKRILSLVQEGLVHSQKDAFTEIDPAEREELQTIAAAIQNIGKELDRQQYARKRIERRLERFESKYLSLYNNAPDMLVSVDPETAIIKECNQTLCNATGYEKDELVGDKIFKIYDESSMDEGILLSDQLAQNKNIDNVELVLLSKNQMPLDVSVKVVKVYDANGKIMEIRLSFRDISELKQAREELETKASELADINKELKEFTYIASHDLKVPISNIEQLTHVLLQEDLTKEEQSEFFGRIHKMVRRSKETIQDLVDVTRLREDTNRNKEWLNVGELFAEIAGNFDDQIQQQGARIYTDFSNADQVYFSRINLKSILQNLLSNSIKYHSPERIPEIRIRTEKKEGFTIIEFEDNGLGIDLEKFRDRIFGMFHRFHSHKEGTGLGLYIVRQLIEKSGGSIEIESEVGVGTTFKISLSNQ